jgi:hypothetical protein
MGVREVVSTWAFLTGLSLNGKTERPTLQSYDVYTSANINEALWAANENNILMEFHCMDVLKADIQETDLLFIDTLHTYTQLKQELAMHAHKVRKYIIFHDVVTYGHTPEPSEFKTHSGTVKQIPEVMANYVKNDKGIMPAINEFLKAEPSWQVEKHYANNNGLLIIKRNG